MLTISRSKPDSQTLSNTCRSSLTVIEDVLQLSEVCRHFATEELDPLAMSIARFVSTLDSQMSVEP
tara:strand:+ start:99534 stop:99731 length:198 start_codon:yes stop_codon:yes gene_type:complete